MQSRVPPGTFSQVRGGAVQEPSGRGEVKEATDTSEGSFYQGNADIDGPLNRGWLLGHFMPEGDLRRSTDVEIKWGVHPPGEERAQWVTREERTSLHVLVSGRFRIEVPGHSLLLARPGDYVVLHQVGHSWRAEEQSVLLSVRWPSVPGYAVPQD